MSDVIMDTEGLRSAMQGGNGVLQHAGNIKTSAQHFNRASELLASSCKCRSTANLVDSINRMQQRVSKRAEKVENISNALVQVANNVENTEKDIVSKISR